MLPHVFIFFLLNTTVFNLIKNKLGCFMHLTEKVTKCSFYVISVYPHTDGGACIKCNSLHSISTIDR